jgi:phytoene/squalene synthetase
MPLSLAAAITSAASRQTYYTVRFLVDRPRRADAYRAYAYFRWVDDVLDGEATGGSSGAATRRPERLAWRCPPRSMTSSHTTPLPGIAPPASS